jgi:hypothetical protein
MDKKGQHMKYKIDKNIPLPETPTRATAAENYKTLLAMEAGDSIFFPHLKNLQVSNRFYNVARRRGMKITVKEEGDGARMWRVR